MSGTSAIHEFLREARVPYVVLPHTPAYTAQEEAAAMHVPGREWAKVVICIVDGEPIEAVLPATQTVNLSRLLDLTGGREIRLAHEEELRRLFPECEPGAMPPFGALYGQAVFVDSSLVGQPEIVFNAGTHADAIAMCWSDFAAATRPVIGSFGESPAGRAGWESVEQI
jgi:Ala-tRNA(Pro) deacylase